ncbi:MAG: hypothetical protein [Arizlama microvirus]|nr:MAG: hypothetical protein [Arizlama microvirus]
MIRNDKLTDTGAEINNDPPVAVPANYKRPLTLAEQVRLMCRTQLSQMAANEGHETWEEADDFDVGDDFDPSSPHELIFDPELGKELPQEIKRELDASRKQFDEEIVKQRKEKAPPAAKKKAKKPEVVDDDED